MAEHKWNHLTHTKNAKEDKPWNRQAEKKTTGVE